MAMQALQSDQYDFSAKPKVVKPRTKYREPEPEEADPKLVYTNLMFDRRVVRGNTYAAIVTSKNTEVLKDAAKFTRPLKKTQQPKEKEEAQNDYEPGTPEPVTGRKHVELQTDELVEQLTDKPPEYEKDTQTDFYIDRPVVRLFMPKKNGTDKESQVWDGDLFDFDYEVEPILAVLIGKTLEQSRMEVLEEEELRVMKEQQKRYEQLRNAELAEMQKLEAKERRLLEESERRKLQYRKNHDLSVNAHQKLVSRVIAKNFLARLKPTVVEVLREQGVFRHPLEQALFGQFLPWVYDQVRQELSNQQSVQSEIAALVEKGVVGASRLHAENFDNEMKRRDAEKEKRRIQQEIREEKRRQREAEKRRKAEMERRARLRDQARDQLVSKGENKANILAANISDIDGNGQEAPFVGLFGGIVGEIITFVLSLERLSKQDERFVSLRDFAQNSENYVTLVKEAINIISEAGSIEIGVNATCEAEITAKDENVKLDNWFLADDKVAAEVQDIIIRNLSSLILRKIDQNADALGLPKNIVRTVVGAVLKQVSNEESLQSKVKIVKAVPKNEFTQAGICYMRPDLSTLPVNARSDRKDQMEEPQNEDEEPRPVQPRNIAEAEFQPNGTVFNPNSEDLRVLVQHPIAETLLRDELLKIVTQQVKAIEQNEYNALVEVTDVARKVQTEVLDLIHPDYPVLEMNGV